MAKIGRLTHKKQHFVPQCYSKAWHDPDAPRGPKCTPYVWQFDRAGTTGRRKAPVNIFVETDIYTIERPDGERDLTLEHGLQELEDKFTRIRNLRFSRREWPDSEQMAWLLAFVVTAHVRTAAHRDFHREQWGRIRQRMEEMEEALDKAPPEQRRAMAAALTPPRDKSRGMTVEDIRRLETYPIQTMLGGVMRAELPILAKMNVAVLCTDDPVGFVTTDCPCTFFNPEAHKLPPIYRSPGLLMKSIEVTLPISPQQCLIITHDPSLTGYIEVSAKVVNELNCRHIAHCDESFIVCRNEIRPSWLEQRPLPDDAWENLHAKEGKGDR